ISQIRAFAQESTWDSIYENQIMSFGSLPAVRKADDPLCKERVKKMRETALKAVKDAQADFYAPSDVIMRDLDSATGAMRALLKLVRLYDKRFGEEKRRRHLLDFSDLEHEAIRLLTTREGKPTAAAEELAEHYREILVDEYQDSNAVQEYIFEAISKHGKNRFMVGDVKQSIYRFRLADPSIFLEKYDLFDSYEDADDGMPRKILLSENFRSRPEILQAVNDVFSLIMNRRAAEFDYTEDEALKNGRPFPSVPQAKVELHCIRAESADDEEDSADKSSDEAQFVAARISRMLREKTLISDGDTTRPVKPSDIVILMRAPGSVTHKYAEALAAYGIESISEQGSSVLSTTEAEVLCAIMQIIDNPHRDVPLVTAMCSPIFMFTPNELAEIRAEKKNCDLFTALVGFAEKSEKVSKFLRWLGEMRAYSKTSALREVFDAVLQTTMLEEVFGCMADGDQRMRTIDFLRTMVDSVSQTGGTLSQFNRTIEQMLETDTVPVLPSMNESANAVRIMSIHKSKGLEFPVVFLADLSRRFNLQDRTDAVLLDEELGIGCNVVDVGNKSYYPSVAKLAIGHKMTAQSVAEEMRVLYVAMTRARDMLVMTYCGAYTETTLQKWNTLLSNPIRTDVPAMARSLGDWVLMAALCRTEAGQLFAVTGENDFSSVHDDAWVITMQGSATTRKTARELKRAEDAPCIDAQRLCAPLQAAYSFEAASSVPSKLTATQLKGRALDAEASDAAKMPIRLNEKPWRQPDFSADLTLTASEKGSAMHLFMQYLRLDACDDLQSIECELRRLVDDGYLTQMQADAIEPKKVMALFASDPGKRIRHADRLRREFKFSILTDAAAYYLEAAGERVMLQGVVDCFWVEDGELVIVDFKTDRICGDLDAKTENYRLQIETYANALSRIFEMKV
ncbi:MAG: UvrD-helicase domain-containing protein, partial [Oscillospiraceae bacterium]|nr:UvrD-helicase domain-containing protein [Oscillospiraceae bacterium]